MLSEALSRDTLSQASVARAAAKPSKPMLKGKQANAFWSLAGDSIFDPYR